MSTYEEFLALLADSAAEIGADLAASKEEVALFMAERAEHLSTITTEPGFDRAVHREAVSVAMKAGLELSDTSRSIDQRWFGIIGAALRIAAVALI